MRLWHYELLPFLPKSQLVAQWRELNTIFKKKKKHILINYVYEYPIEELLGYTYLVIEEMQKRGFVIKSVKNCYDYFGDKFLNTDIKVPSDVFLQHHNFRYLLQCFYNLQEKYDRGQKDFSKERYNALEFFVNKERFLNNVKKISNDMGEFSKNMEKSLNNMNTKEKNEGEK